jgi:hypothetical protein
MIPGVCGSEKPDFGSALSSVDGLIFPLVIPAVRARVRGNRLVSDRKPRRAKWHGGKSQMDGEKSQIGADLAVHRDGGIAMILQETATNPGCGQAFSHTSAF